MRKLLVCLRIEIEQSIPYDREHINVNLKKIKTCIHRMKKNIVHDLSKKYNLSALHYLYICFLRMFDFSKFLPQKIVHESIK